MSRYKVVYLRKPENIVIQRDLNTDNYYFFKCTCAGAPFSARYTHLKMFKTDDPELDVYVKKLKLLSLLEN